MSNTEYTEYSDTLSTTELEMWAFKFQSIAVYSTVEVSEDGGLDESADEDRPTYIDDILTEGWVTVSDGYTSQHSYNGPVMHDSELFGGALTERVINEPGVYAVIPSEYTYEDDCGHLRVFNEGWVVVRMLSGVGEEMS